MSGRNQRSLQQDLFFSFLLHLIPFIVLYGISFVPTNSSKDKENTEIFEISMLTDFPSIKHHHNNQKVSNKVTHLSKETNGSVLILKEALKRQDKDIPEKKKKTKETKRNNIASIHQVQKSLLLSEKKENRLDKKKEIAVQGTKQKKKLNQFSKKDEDFVDSLLATLEDEEFRETTEDTFLGLSGNSKFSKKDAEASGLSLTEKMIIKKQIEDNWTQNTESLQEIKVTVGLELDIEGFITKVEVKNIICPLVESTQICSLVAENAKRAVKKTNQIINLDPNRYDHWKKFDLNFCPSKL